MTREIVGLTVWVNGVPVPQGRPRFTRTGRVYTPKATAAWHRKVADAAEFALLNAPDFPAEAPIGLELSFFLPIPDSWPKWKRDAAARGEVAPTGKPDTDNLTKAVLDGLNGVLFKDDAQVVSITARKEYRAERPGVLVTLFPLPFPISSTTKRKPTLAAEEAATA